MNRRAVLRGAWLGGAAAALARMLAGCATAPRGTVARAPATSVHVDESFARLVLESLERREPDEHLLGHPALAAMVRHQHLSGNLDATKEAVLASVLNSAGRARPTPRVLDAWTRRHSELGDYVTAAAHYLPAGTRFTGTVYLVVGYDIGVAAPPDLVLNVAHEHFQAAPSELGFYATHEAHHVGFFAVRPVPGLTGLDDPVRLRRIVAYMTQLEGMGVHAAFPLRRERGSLGLDSDYRVYTDPAEARRVMARYAGLVAMLERPGRLSDDDIGMILGAMSSGERVWYQLGALACWTLERAQGRGALIEAIANPRAFDSVVTDLLTTA